MGRSDEDLVRSIPTDQSAYEEFYRRFVRDLTRFVARRCDQPADVADVVSATFLAVPGAARRFDPRRGNARSWLFGIGMNQILESRRRSAIERGLLHRLAGQRVLEPDDISVLEHQVEAARLEPQISASLAAAPASERELFLLVAEDGLTPREAAAVLDISPVAARVRLSRVRARLRRSLEQAPAAPAPPTSTPREAQ